MKTFKLSLFQTIVCLILLLTLADSRKSIGIDPKYQKELEELERQSARYDRMTKNKLAETDDQVIVLEKKKRSRKEEHEELKIYEKYFDDWNSYVTQWHYDTVEINEMLLEMLKSEFKFTEYAKEWGWGK